jgi:26S proteasome regulatory subunit T2
MPHTRCRLRLLKLERIKDYLVMEQEFIQNQERLKPQEEKNQVRGLPRCDSAELN